MGPNNARNYTMNEYQKRCEHKYSADAECVVELVAALNKVDGEDWAIVPRDNSLDHTPDRHIIVSSAQYGGSHNLPTGLRIVCNHNGYGLDNRWRFSACGWPTYVDNNGHEVTVDTRRMYSPRESNPVTTAADSRSYDAIAKQIVNKLIKPYRELWVRAADIAISNSNDVAAEEAALQAVTEAAGEAYEFGTFNNRHIRARSGDDFITIEFRSSSDVVMHLTAEQAIAALAVIS
jgi:hypothetical protein